MRSSLRRHSEDYGRRLAQPDKRKLVGRPCPCWKHGLWASHLEGVTSLGGTEPFGTLRLEFQYSITVPVS